MSNLIVRPIAELQVISKAAFDSGFYGFKNQQQAFIAVIASQDMGMNATKFMQDYHIVNNRPVKKTETAFRDFKRAGGRCKWIHTGDDYAEAELIAPDEDSIVMRYTIEQATKADLVKAGSNWIKNPSDMLRNRVLSKGIKAIYPQAYDGFMSDDEAIDIQVEETKQVEEIETVEVIEEPKINIDDLKKKLKLKLQIQGLTVGVMKEFYNNYDLDNNLENLERMVTDEDYLLKCIEQFEKEGN